MPATHDPLLLLHSRKTVWTPMNLNHNGLENFLIPSTIDLLDLLESYKMRY